MIRTDSRRSVVPTARYGAWAFSVVMWVTGCGGDTSDAPTAQTAAQHTTDELDVGATGNEVIALHDYLGRYGYFPNEQVVREYPSWRPAVATAPRRADTFDESTRSAVKIVQTNGGLPPTGRVDAATRELLEMPRCGVPDGLSAREAPSEPKMLAESEAGTDPDAPAKFEIWEPLAHRALTWKLVGRDEVTHDQARAAVNSVLAAYSRETNLTFTETTGSTPDILLVFESLDGPSGLLASAHSGGTGTPAGNLDIISIDTLDTWSVALPTPAGMIDLESVLLHEVGHALGLSHSSIPGAVMSPWYAGTQRALNLDDRVAISTLYDQWMVRPGAATDIAVGANGSVWKVAVDTSGASSVARWNSASWTFASSVAGAYRIAVRPNGIPWVVTSGGDLWSLSADDPLFGTWTRMSRLPAPASGRLDGARDVAIGADGSAWAVGRDPAGLGYPLFKRDTKGGWTPDATGRRASRVAVGPDGVPWIVDEALGIYRRSSSMPASGSWSAVGLGHDIAINAGNYAWLVGFALRAGGYAVHLRNEQPAISPGGPIARWREILGAGAVSIAVTPNGAPWIVTDTGAIISRGP